MSLRVLVGGGTGFVGGNLTRLLTSKGYEVKVISRRPSKNNLTWDDISKDGIPDGTKYIVNLAGENVLNFKKRWTESFKNDVFKSRVETTRLLSEAIKNSKVKPKVFVSISGVGIYPPSDSQKYDETSTVKEFDFLSNLCHKWEAAAKSAESDACKVAIIRSGVVLGRDGGMIRDLYLPFSLGLGGPIGSGEQFLPWIHLDDLTNLILHSMESEIGGTMNGVAPNPATNLQFTKAFAKSLNRPAFIPVPTFVFDLLFGNERAKMVTEGQCVLPEFTLKTSFKYKYNHIQEACDSFVV